MKESVNHAKLTDNIFNIFIISLAIRFLLTAPMITYALLDSVFHWIPARELAVSLDLHAPVMESASRFKVFAMMSSIARNFINASTMYAPMWILA